MNDRTVIDKDAYNLDLTGAQKVVVRAGVTVGSKSTEHPALRVGRASSTLSSRPAMRARTSSRESGTSQASAGTAPRPQVPAKPFKGRASGQLSPKVSMRAPSPSRRKAGAETIMVLSPMGTVSPLSSQPVGQRRIVTQATDADGPLQPGDHRKSDSLKRGVAGPPIESGGERHQRFDTQGAHALAAAIDEIKEQWKRRQMWHRAEKSLTLQAKAMCRRLMQGDKKEAEVLYKSALNGGEHDMAATAYLAMHPLLEARKGIEVARLQVEKRLLVIAKQLPVAAWVEGVRGAGILSLAGIIGEAGDLSSYSNPAKLWKRMGLAVIGGERQRKKEGAAGIEHGYNPARRSLMWTIGDCIIRAGGPLKELYNQRKEYEAPRVKTKMHAHNRAKRYIEKRLLRNLWRAWRDAARLLTPIMDMRPSEVQ